MNPEYPIYIPTKGRWEKPLTAKWLLEMGVPFKAVVEPQEYNNYADSIGAENILTLPFSNLGLGVVPARNWIWEHSVQAGARWHWEMDDNIDGFFRQNNNFKIRVMSGSIFKATEDFVERYENVGQAGLNYFMFDANRSITPPFYLNTRCYSCILNNNFSHSFRWRGRWNEDTDLSLRILKAGFCTILMNAFLALKQTTSHKNVGGNAEGYKEHGGGDWQAGRLASTMELYKAHPDVVTVTRKWNRPHHHVNYKVFKQKLIRKPGWNYSGINNYGMKLVKIK